MDSEKHLAFDICICRQKAGGMQTEQLGENMYRSHLFLTALLHRSTGRGHGLTGTALQDTVHSEGRASTVADRGNPLSQTKGISF